MSAKIIRLLEIMCLALLGCANLSTYEPFYKQQAPQSFASTETAIYVEGVPNADKTHNDYFTDFIPIGRLDFNGIWNGAEPLITYGLRVGADVVIVSATNAKDKEVNSSVSMPTINTNYVSGYNSDGTYFSGTSTNYGSQTIPVHYTVRRYDQTAIFLKRTEGSRCPWEYTRSDFPIETSHSDEFTGLWERDGVQVEVFRARDEYVAFLINVSEEKVDKIKKELDRLKVPWQGWKRGGLKFRFNRKSREGLYIGSSDNATYAATLAFNNKFKYLEIILVGDKDIISFTRKR